ncbi:TIGR04066 family peptide maturation system protein [Ruminiclostridium josui]|uniref:TIGR04066 family peptide maturation system protein n=1 Tax=Ruminiclostridium josui TaxID=1499 RepID=UPI0006D02052|nr:TIGR04066 family peptide maturation system protein [Ruminiclostridium josui]
MSKKKRAIIYPYDFKSFPLLKSLELITDYEIVDFVSPNGWGLTERDAGDMAGVSTGHVVHGDFSSSIEDCDAVIFTESYIALNYSKVLRPKIFEAADKGKDILSILSIEENQVEEISQYCDKKGAKFTYYPSNGQDFLIGDIEPKISEGYSIKEPKVPVVLVFGNGERANKFDIQLTLRKFLLENGYRVGQIGSRHYCELFGFHSFPKFMFDKRVDNVEKIQRFNRFVLELEKREDPDIIVIGVPGGIMPYTDKYHNYFGLVNYMVSQAISPDFAIFSTLFEEYFPEYFNQIKLSIKYKLGYDVNAFNLSNTKVSWDATAAKDAMQYITLAKLLLIIIQRSIGGKVCRCLTP